MRCRRPRAAPGRGRCSAQATRPSRGVNFSALEMRLSITSHSACDRRAPAPGRLDGERDPRSSAPSAPGRTRRRAGRDRSLRLEPQPARVGARDQQQIVDQAQQRRAFRSTTPRNWRCSAPRSPTSPARTAQVAEDRGQRRPELVRGQGDDSSSPAWRAPRRSPRAGRRGDRGGPAVVAHRRAVALEAAPERQARSGRGLEPRVDEQRPEAAR